MPNQPVGSFDPTAVPAGWFDDQATPPGFFDEDLLLGPDPPAPRTILRPPFFVRRFPLSRFVAVHALGWVWQDLLETTLGSGAPVPFAQLNWPTPPRVASAAPWLAPPNRLLDLFAPAGAITIFRLPVAMVLERPSAMVALLAQRDVWSNGLLGLFVPTAAPFAQLNWPNPLVLSMLSVQTSAWTNGLLGLFQPPTAGGVPAIWLRRRRRQED